MKRILILMVLVQMVLISKSFSQVKVIAHRGAWKNTGVPENSIASLKHAIAMGCYGSEFDVHMSSDSVLFIHHDPVIEGDTIENTTSEVLLKLKLSNGETLPTLKNYLEAGKKQKRTRLVLEIKPSVISKERGIELSHKVLAMVKAMKVEAMVDYISFDYEICLELIKLAPKANVAYLKGDKTPEELAADHFYGLDYHFSFLAKDPSIVRNAKEKNLTIDVWTVNEESVMDTLISQSVDFITTNEPELLLKKLKK